MNRRVTKLIFTLAFFGVSLGSNFAQTTYQIPPKEIADLVNSPSTPSVVFNKSGDWMLLLERAGNPSIEDLAQPELRIAGLRLNPATSGPSRTRSVENLKVKMTAGGEEIQIKGLPAKPKMDGFSLSRDEKYLAFTQTESTGISLWVVDMSTFQARQLTENILNDVMGGSLIWTPEHEIIIRATNPARGEIPKAPAAPSGPIVQESSGNAAPNRTYQDLLANPHDEALFAYFMDSQLMVVNLDGSKKPIGLQE